jgi:hypothetical protein
MNAIEPIKFVADGSGLDLSEYSSRISGPNSKWDETHDFILHYSLSDMFDELSGQSMSEEFQNLLDERLSDSEEILPSIRNHVIRIFAPPVQVTTPVYYMNGVTCVPNPDNNGIFYMISNNKNQLRDIRDRVIENINDAPETYGPMGIDDVEVYSGREFTLEMVRNITEVNSIQTGESNDFENQIYEKLEPISEAFVHNVTVSFDYPQEPEYDILFSLAPELTLCLEVEDHSGTDSEPGEADLIDSPAQESDFINAKQVFATTKGVSSETLGELRPKAELTNVDVLDRERCAERVRSYIEDEMLPKAMETNAGGRFFS